MTPEEFRANEMAMKAFGLLPRDYNLKEALAQVYSEEIAAFYDPKTKTMHLIEEPKKAEAKKKPGLPRAALRQGRRLRQGREQDRHRPRADPRPGRSALRPRRPAEGRQEGRRPLDGALGPDRGRGDPHDARGRHGRLGRHRDREDPLREPRQDLQAAGAVPAVHGRRQEPAPGPGDHLRVDDLPLFQGRGVLRQAGQRRRLEVDRRGVSQRSPNRPSRSSTRRNSWPTRIGRCRSTSAAEARRRLEGAGPERPGRDADGRAAPQAERRRRRPPAGTATATPSSRGPRIGWAWSG